VQFDALQANLALPNQILKLQMVYYFMPSVAGILCSKFNFVFVLAKVYLHTAHIYLPLKGKESIR